MQYEMYYDRKHDFSLEQVGEAMAAAGGGGGAGLGAGMEGADMGGDMEIPEEGAAPPEGEEGAPADLGAAAEEAGPLLATPGGEGAPELPAEPGPEAVPGKRDPGAYTTPGANGKMYTKVQSDSRPIGARRRAHKALRGEGPRDVIPGKKDIDALRKISYSFSESLKSSYDDEEKTIFKENFEIKKLIGSLENSIDEV
jgi:hypothetical protein